MSPKKRKKAGRRTGKPAVKPAKMAAAGHKKRLSDEFMNFLRSFRELGTVKALVVASFDAMLYVLLFIFSSLLAYVMTFLSKKLQSIHPETLAAMPAEQLAGPLADTKSKLTMFLTYFMIVAFIYLVLVVLSFTMSRYLIWTTLLGKKLKNRIFWKFTLLNIMWIIVLTAVFVVLSLPIKSLFTTANAMFVYMGIAYGIFTLVAAYFTYLLYYTFLEENLVFISIRTAFAAGARKFRVLWFPAVLIILTFVVASAISLISNYLPIIIKSIFTGLLLLAALTWMKLYAVSAMKRYVKV